MKRDKAAVGTAEAADILGVTTQTVRNLAARGVLPYCMRGNKFKFDPKALLPLAPQFSGVADAERGLEEAEALLREEQRRVHLKAAQLREQRDGFFRETFDVQNMASMIRTWKSLFTLFTRGLPPDKALTAAEMTVMEEMLAGHTVEHCALMHGYTPKSVRVIKERALRALLKTRSVIEENDGLRRENEMLRKENEALKTGRDGAAHVGIGTDCRDLPLSARAKGAVLATGSRTVGDLVRLRKEDLTGAGRCGKRTVDEINRLLAAGGLWLGMDWPDIHRALESQPPMNSFVGLSRANAPAGQARLISPGEKSLG